MESLLRYDRRLSSKAPFYFSLLVHAMVALAMAVIARRDDVMKRRRLAISLSAVNPEANRHTAAILYLSSIELLKQVLL